MRESCSSGSSLLPNIEINPAPLPEPRQEPLQRGGAWLTTPANSATASEQVIGIAQSTEEALKWYRKAADQGDREAQKKVQTLSVQSSGSQGTLIRKPKVQR
jgi:hypothetical protein